MVSNVQNHQHTRVDQCPHGMSFGSCPICNPSKMGGGGKKADKPERKAGEWSYARCLAVGRQMRAQKANAEAQKLEFQAQLKTAAEKLAKNLENLSYKIQNMIQNIKNPQVQQVVQTFTNTLMNVLNQIPKVMNLISNGVQKFNQMLQGAAEKLTAILGDVKNFISRKFFKDIKKRAKKILFSFFTILEGENYKDDETLAVFKSREMRKFIVKIFRKNERRKDDAAGRIEKQTTNKFKNSIAAGKP